MPDVKRERDHAKDQSQTATLEAGRDLSKTREQTADLAKSLDAAAKTGNPARLADVRQRHDAIRQELDRRANVPGSAEKRQGVDQARDAVRALDERQTSALKETARAGADAYQSIARAAERIEAAQRRETDALTARPSAAADLQRLAEHQARQTRDLHEIAGRFTDAFRAHESAQANAMRNDDEQLVRAALGAREDADAGARTDLVNAALADADHRQQELQNDLRGAIRNLENDLTAVEASLAPRARDGMREELHDTQLKELDDRALDRIVAAALEGQERRAAMNAEELQKSAIAAVDRVKGQLLEEAFRAQAQAEARELSQRLGKDVQFIEGHRIRDAESQKLTDGVLAWTDQVERLHIERAYEAKAGTGAAKVLNEEVSKLTEKDLQQARKYAGDLAIERYVAEHRDQEPEKDLRNLQLETATGKQLETLQRYRDEALKELQTRDARRDIGQKDKTIERLHETVNGPTRVYVDGKPRTLAVNQGRTDVKAVLPEDVRRMAERDAIRVALKADEIKKAAERLLDRLKRDGVWR